MRKKQQQSEDPEQRNKENWLYRCKHSPHLLGHLLGYDKLVPLHSKWIKNCWDKPSSHGLMAFRGSYKTTAVVITGIVRYLLFKPSARIIMVRKTHDEACKVVRAVSRAFEKPEVQALFYMAHGVTPVKTEDAKNHLLFNFKQTTTVESSLTAKGIYDAVTGAHADVIIHDDIMGLKDKTSRAERERTKTAVREYAGNILDPGALDIYLGTKWDREDAWTVIEEFADVQKYPESKYNNFIDKAEIEGKKKRLTPFLQAINYELELTADEDLLFQDPRYGYFDPEIWRTGKKIFAHIDAAYGGGDTCALTIMCEAPNSYDETHAIGWCYEGNVQNWYGFIVRQCKKYHCEYLLMENNADKGFLAKDLGLQGLQCRTYAEHMNKEIKISTYLYQSWHDIIWDEETDPVYMNQILDWKPDSKGHDDAPDSAASILREAFGKSTVLDEEDRAFFHGR